MRKVINNFSKFICLFQNSRDNNISNRREKKQKMNKKYYVIINDLSMNFIIINDHYYN